jgi:hypothetical protein
MLLTVLALGTLLGVAVSRPLLSWGRRLDRRLLAVIDRRCLFSLGVLVSLSIPAFLVLWVLGLGVGLGQFVPSIVYIAIGIGCSAWRIDSRRCRWPLYGVAALILLVMLLDLGSRLG